MIVHTHILNGVSAFTLKITVNQDNTAATLKLEGRLAGAWIPECVRAWQELAPSLGPKKLRLDLRGLTFVDSDGALLLSEIYRKNRPQFLTNTPLSKYFAEQAIRTGSEPISGSQDANRKESQ